MFCSNPNHQTPTKVYTLEVGTMPKDEAEKFLKDTMRRLNGERKLRRFTELV